MNLVETEIEKLTAENFENLVNNKVSESTTLEFKRDSYGDSLNDRKELLKDVTALANTRGGMILIGIDEVDGCASKITPFSGNVDNEIQRLNDILQSSIEPIISQLEIKAISVNEGKCIIVIKVPASWAAPHRTNFKGVKRFYRRHSSGVYEPDVTELKKMFIASIEHNDQFRYLRHEHINSVRNAEAPVAMPEIFSSYMLLQIIPLQSIEHLVHLDLNAYDLKNILKPLGGAVGGYQYNIDGFLTFRSRFISYTQLYRNGIIETATCSIARKFNGNSESKAINGPSLSADILGGTARYLSVLKNIGIRTPIRVYLTFLDVRNCRFATYYDQSGYDQYGIGEDEALNFRKNDVLLPPVDIMDYGNRFATYEFLRPIMDALWNADNRERCDYYDDNGKWVGHQDVKQLSIPHP